MPTPNRKNTTQHNFRHSEIELRSVLNKPVCDATTASRPTSHPTRQPSFRRRAPTPTDFARHPYHPSWTTSAKFERWCRCKHYRRRSNHQEQRWPQRSKHCLRWSEPYNQDRDLYYTSDRLEMPKSRLEG